MRDLFARRNILIGAGGLALAGGAAFGTRSLLRKHYAPSPYDDLLARLEDRDAATIVGRAVLAAAEDFDVKSAVTTVHSRLAHSTLAEAGSQDVAAGRLLEVRGWVVPETLGLLCALAAMSS